MLSMDQILASNELTIATTAALPAFALIGSAIYLLRQSMQPSQSRAVVEMTQRLRIAVVQLERALQDLLHHSNGSADAPVRSHSHASLTNEDGVKSAICVAQISFYNQL